MFHLKEKGFAIALPLLLATAVSFAQTITAKSCPAYTVGIRPSGALTPNFDLIKLRNWIKNPVPTATTSVPNPNSTNTDLVILSPHRGYWQFCPEDTLEAYMAAIDKGPEMIEMDVRITAPGVDSTYNPNLDGSGTTGQYFANGESFLTHDYDLRGEAPDPNGTNNVIYLSTPDQLQGRAMVDRYGNPAYDSSNDKITFHRLTDLLKLILRQAKITSGAISPKAGTNGRDLIIRGSMLLFDEKGNGEKNPYTNTAYPYSSQLAAVTETMNEVHEFELANNVDFSNVTIYTINPQANYVPAGKWTTLVDQNYPDPSHQPGFLGYMYPIAGSPTQDPSVALPYQSLPGYLMFNWFDRWDNSPGRTYAASDLANGKGIDTFYPSNNFPEGYRGATGLCLDALASQFTALKIDIQGCRMQPLNRNYQAAPDYIWVPKAGANGTPYSNATARQPNLYDDIINYLTILGLRNTSHIQ